jgi:hypothetical protein
MSALAVVRRSGIGLLRGAIGGTRLFRLPVALLGILLGSAPASHAFDDSLPRSLHFSPLFDPLDATLVRAILGETSDTLPDAFLAAAERGSSSLKLFRVTGDKYCRGQECLYVVLDHGSALTLHGRRDVYPRSNGGLVFLDFETRCTRVTISFPFSSSRIDTIAGEGCLGK